MAISLRTTLALVIAFIVLAGIPAVGQQSAESELPGNPYRRAGGRCVYGKNGEVLYAPADARCDGVEPPATGTAPASAGERFGGLPAALRAEASALIDSHEHVADDLAELRRAVANGDKATALDLSDEVVKELVDHLAREERFFERIASEHRTH